ncbi:MAG: tetratricopeptide repeat protein [Chitinophagaceae bacterium]|nr:MAG: tetratricopeptide repeat protein [Chitinophagaceae bacterium]
MDTQVMFERAQLLHGQGRFTEAIQELKLLLGQEPQHAAALALYGRCLIDQHQYPEGIRLIDSAISLDPYNGYYFYLKAFAFYRQNANDKAILLLNKSISIEPWRAAPYGLLAIIYIEEKKFQEALTKADEGLAIDPTDITCLNARAMALNKMKRTDDAIETMQEALSQDPDNEFTHSTFGWNLLEKGRHREAREHFREALRIDPNYENARAGLKESLKSNIPPYRWLLQYSFWVTNKGKKAGWAIPLLIYAAVRVISSTTRSNESTAMIGVVVVLAYFVFVVATWIINPVANFFLLFNKDGKYALNASEKWTAITVMGSLFLGLAVLVTAWFSGLREEFHPVYIIAFALLLMAVPLGDIRYPLAFRGNGTTSTIGMVLTGVGLLTILTAILLPEFALTVGFGFLLLFILNNWLGLFRNMRR